MSINKVMITGNLTRDPEMRTTSTGMSIMRLGVAVNDRRRNPQTDQWEDVPNYIDCVMFGTRAASVSRFLTKGQKVAIEGKLRWSSWEDRQTGGKRSKIEVVIDDLEFMTSRNAGSGDYSGTAPAAASSYEPAKSYDNIPPAPPTADAYADEDIPF